MKKKKAKHLQSNNNKMKQHKIILAVLCLLVGGYSNAQGSSKIINVLIVDGQNNHVQWPKTTHMLKTYLEGSGLFKVDIQRSAYTWEGEEFIKEIPIGQKTENLTQISVRNSPNTMWSFPILVGMQPIGLIQHRKPLKPI
jgi:hypothetical protein